MNLCFAKCEKVIVFWGAIFGHILVDVRKNTIKIGISAHVSKQNKQKMTIFNGYELVQVRVIIWSKFRVKKGQLGSVNNCSNLSAQFLFVLKNVAKPLFIELFSCKQCSKSKLWPVNDDCKTPNLDQLITPQHIYIYICICVYVYLYIHIFVYILTHVDMHICVQIEVWREIDRVRHREIDIDRETNIKRYRSIER